MTITITITTSLMASLRVTIQTSSAMSCGAWPGGRYTPSDPMVGWVKRFIAARAKPSTYRQRRGSICIRAVRGAQLLATDRASARVICLVPSQVCPRAVTQAACQAACQAVPQAATVVGNAATGSVRATTAAHVNTQVTGSVRAQVECRAETPIRSCATRTVGGQIIVQREADTHGSGMPDVRARVVHVALAGICIDA